MKKAFKLKAFMLSLIMTALLLPMTSFAQQISDGFFCVDDAFNGNRDVLSYSLTGSLTNDDFGTPLGSGLLILTAVGAGYAIARRKRSFRKGTTLMLAALLLLGMTDCKKKAADPIVPASVKITLNVSGDNDGSKVEVNPPHVTFENGDKVLVGYNDVYIGTLTHNGENFSGTVTVGGDNTKPLYFYFVGNKDTGTLTEGTTTSCTVNISDQSTELPVLSFSASNENYNGGGTYTASLHNQCALVKFTMENPAGSVQVGSMHTEATISFATPGITPTATTGSVRLNSKSKTEKWAILLPQEAVTNATVTIGSENLTVNVPAITRNAYITDIPAIANTAVSYGDLSQVTADYEAQDGDILYGTLGGNYKITIAADATVTLNSVTINGTNSSSYKWAGITCLGDATIILSGTNNVKGFYEDYPGIYVPENKTVTIQGSGSLTASSNDWGAGIGGGREIACGAITISGGTITATGGQSGAGIGGGYRGTCGNITISGGTITATGGVEAAGIGSGGHGASCGDITISGGTVEATGGYRGAGIGTGDHASCGNITITSGVTCVTATKGTDATNSIGAGYYSTCGTVTIGGNVGAITTSPYTYPAPAATSLSELKTAINGGTDCSSYIGWEVNSAGAIAASSVSGTKIGYVAYVSTSDVDAGVSGSRILVIASVDAGTSIAWGSKGTSRGLTADDLNGYSKTNTLQGYGSGAHPAAYAAWNYSATIPSGGATPAHWFMPTKKQWENMRDAKGGTYGAMAAAYGISSHYWTSTEDSNNNAWRFVTNSNIQSNMKSNNYNVRSIFAY